MSDRYYSAGDAQSGGNNGDLYRFSGDGQNNPANNARSTDLYRYSGDQQTGGTDPWCNDRMPGRQQQRDVQEQPSYSYQTTDRQGNAVIYNIYAKNVYINENPPSGADYRTNPEHDFRRYDQACANQRGRNSQNYYANGGDDGYQIPRGYDQQRYNYNNGDNGYSYASGYPQDGGYNGYNASQQYRMACEQQLRQQMYEQNARNYANAYPQYNENYYQNDGYSYQNPRAMYYQPRPAYSGCFGQGGGNDLAMFATGAGVALLAGAIGGGRHHYYGGRHGW